MADLGAIANLTPLGSQPFFLRDFPNYGATTLADMFANLTGIIGGTVLENGDPIADCEVYVLWRPTMKVIARTATDANGNWEISGFDPAKTEHYTVVIKDKSGGTVYNDAIYALVVPV